MNYKTSNLTICNMIWKSNADKTNSKIDEIVEYIKTTNSYTNHQLLQIKSKLLHNFLPLYLKKWKQVMRSKKNFLTKYAKFLEQDFVVKLSNEFDNSTPNVSTSDDSVICPIVRKGRPCLSFEESSRRTKNRRAQELASTSSKETLIKALKKKEADSDSDLEMTTNNILAMYMDIDLTVRKYKKLKVHNKRIYGTNLFPSYESVLRARENCFPEHVQLSDSGASVHLIFLLEHTTKRILSQFNIDILKQLSNKKLVLVGKWGMDGASGQQTTRQKWSSQYQISPIDDEYESSDDDVYNKDDTDVDKQDEKNNDHDVENGACADGNDLNNKSNCDEGCIIHSDNAVFLISFAPLQLKAADDVIWTNKTPSSVHFCRIIKFEFVKETNAHVLSEFQHYTQLLKKCETYCFNLTGLSFEVSFDLKCTMIDGKVCNVLTGQKASTCCNICGIGPKFINNLDYVKSLPCNEDNYKFGLSTLHCWIRFMEYLLHIAYNYDFKKSFPTTTEEKRLKELRKKHIKNVLKSNLSLPVDIVKQGFGTTNTGNLARSFFTQASEISKFTDLDEGLIRRLHNTLQVLTCGKMINCDKFKIYCFQTAELCIQLYGWYKMPPSLHKVLIHGSDIIRSFNLPFGWLSEEPAESNNKIFRKARAKHSRMSNRKMTNKDILHYMLISSDPLISSLRIKEVKKMKPLSKEAEEMLL